MIPKQSAAGSFNPSVSVPFSVWSDVVWFLIIKITNWIKSLIILTYNLQSNQRTGYKVIWSIHIWHNQTQLVSSSSLCCTLAHTVTAYLKQTSGPKPSHTVQVYRQLICTVYMVWFLGLWQKDQRLTLYYISLHMIDDKLFLYFTHQTSLHIHIPLFKYLPRNNNPVP